MFSEACGNLGVVVDPELGALTVDPRNVGTGFRASAHIKVPALYKSGGIGAIESIVGIDLDVRGSYGFGTPV